jgi:hypothetical protein
MNTRRWGPGERLVFEPYTKEAHAETVDWITKHRIFAEGEMGPGRYEDSVISFHDAESAVPLLHRHGDAAKDGARRQSGAAGIIVKIAVADDLAGGVEAEDRFAGPGDGAFRRRFS